MGGSLQARPILIAATWMAFLSTIVAGRGLAAGDEATFRVTPGRVDDRVEAKVEGGRVTFSIRSPSGIGRATIERTGGRWPRSIVLRLHLRGLEHFRASDGKVRLDVAVSTEGRIIRSRDDSPVEAEDPYRVGLRILDAEGKAAGPLLPEGGSFEVVLPEAFFEDDPKSIKLEWVDFYRG